MRILFLAVFVGGLTFTPVYVFDSLVIPELLSMKESYSNFDKAAEEIVASEPVVQPATN
jgi:hypothetical protein